MERLCMWPIASSQLVDVTCLITAQLNSLHTQFVCASIGYIHSVYEINIKGGVITVITD